jgi:Uma2 family endonuclease
VPSHAQQTALASPEEYLASERQSEVRNEYVGGQVLAMTGGGRSHGIISLNIAASLHGQLRGHPCEVYSNDMRVTVSRTRAYFYPDVVVVCGGPQVEDAHEDTLVNPTLIVEVLSPSTKEYDHGTKWEHYRQLPSLQDYLLVAQDRPRVERVYPTR